MLVASRPVEYKKASGAEHAARLMGEYDLESNRTLDATLTLSEHPEVVVEILKHLVAHEGERRPRVISLLADLARSSDDLSVRNTAERGFVIALSLRLLSQDEIPGDLQGVIMRRLEQSKLILDHNLTTKRAGGKAPWPVKLDEKDFAEETFTVIGDPALLESTVNYLRNELAEGDLTRVAHALSRLHILTEGMKEWIKNDHSEALSVVLSLDGFVEEMYPELVVGEAMGSSLLPSLLRSALRNPLYSEQATKLMAYCFVYGLEGGPYRGHLIDALKHDDLPGVVTEGVRREIIRIAGEKGVEDLERSLESDRSAPVFPVVSLAPTNTLPSFLPPRERTFTKLLHSLVKMKLVSGAGEKRIRSFQRELLNGVEGKTELEAVASLVQSFLEIDLILHTTHRERTELFGSRERVSYPEGRRSKKEGDINQEVPLPVKAIVESLFEPRKESFAVSTLSACLAGIRGEPVDPRGTARCFLADLVVIGNRELSRGDANRELYLRVFQKGTRSDQPIEGVFTECRASKNPDAGVLILREHTPDDVGDGGYAVIVDRATGKLLVNHHGWLILDISPDGSRCIAIGIRDPSSFGYYGPCELFEGTDLDCPTRYPTEYRLGYTVGPTSTIWWSSDGQQCWITCTNFFSREGSLEIFTGEFVRREEP